MESKHIKFINILESKVINQPKLFSARIGALVVYKNKPIAFGQNYFRTDPFQAKYNGNGFQLQLHAEVNAIKKSLKKISLEQLSKSIMYVVRLKFSPDSGHFEWGLSKPCQGCQKCLVEFGIQKIIYTTDEGGCAFL